MNALHPWQLSLATFAGWINRHRHDQNVRLQRESRILTGKPRGKQIRFSD
ncbi:MAG: hypothetical protein JSV78_12855 [Phycisphaerales bacterium]|nr:MAG: hypothetical protein JSV78_12855 [Phycisphaerales bacterium]